MSADGIGAAVRRKEDFRFLTGQGTYTDDIDRPGQVHAVLLRSPHAHATIKTLDTGANCTVNVSFSPTATGTRTGTLSIKDKALTSVQKIALTGTGK